MKRKVRRRRLVALGTTAALLGVLVGALIASGAFDHALQELTLPLRHEDVIRQQADEKGVDAALIAAVIYSESKFRDQTSSAGARGLMQITPEAADTIARNSNATTFELEDLGDPEINIRYGTFLLAEFLERYDGDEAAALAAYNAGPGAVDKYGGIPPFAETQSYVKRVMSLYEKSIRVTPAALTPSMSAAIPATVAVNTP